MVPRAMIAALITAAVAASTAGAQPDPPQVPLLLEDVEPFMQALRREQSDDKTVPPIRVIGARHHGLPPTQLLKVFCPGKVNALKPAP